MNTLDLAATIAATVELLPPEPAMCARADSCCGECFTAHRAWTMERCARYGQHITTGIPSHALIHCPTYGNERTPGL